jgi:hypothetical protein
MTRAGLWPVRHHAPPCPLATAGGGQAYRWPCRQDARESSRWRPSDRVGRVSRTPTLSAISPIGAHMATKTATKKATKKATTKATTRTTKDDSKSSKGGDALEQAKGQVEGVAAGAEQASEDVKGEARQVAGKHALKELPYAAVGLGDVVADAARRVDATTLAERLRRTPVVVGSKVLDLGANATESYLALVARGRALRLQAAGEDATEAAREQTEAVIAQAEEAVGQGGGVAAATLDRAKAAAGKVRDLAARGAKGAGEAAESAADAGAAAGGEVADAAGTASTTAADGAQETAGRAAGVLGKVKGAVTRGAKRTEEETDESDEAESAAPGGDADEAEAAPKKRRRKKVPAAEAAEDALDTGSGALAGRSLKQLRNRAEQLGIEGRAKMKKDDLVEAIRDAT